jgi:N-acetylglutamate synthase-like GNAT family acetyltransferase
MGPAGVKIRVARRGDATPVAALLNEAGAQGADAHTFAWVLSHPEMEMFVAADPLDKVVGIVTLSHRPLLKMGGRSGVIEEFVVSPPWRGKGIGRELLRRAVERARVLSVRRLEMQSFDKVTAPLSTFLESCGFDPIDVGVFRLRS